jgi:hypothetical protein
MRVVATKTKLEDYREDVVAEADGDDDQEANGSLPGGSGIIFHCCSMQS